MPELALFDWLIFAATGAVAGLAAGYLGIGGGMVIVPVLSLFLQHKFPLFNSSTQMAVATSLATILVTGSAATLSHYRQGKLSWSKALQLAPGLFAGALLGTWVADQISSQWLLRIFALFALLSGVRMMVKKQTRQSKFELSRLWLGISGFLIGSLSSLLGIGGGTLSVPLLTASRIAIHQAVAIASAAGVVIAIAGTLGFILAGLNSSDLPPGALGYVYLPAWLGIVLVSALSAPMGARLVHKSKAGRVRVIFGVLLVLVAVRLILRSF